jgi:cellulose synthase/poly-beta-1,6-N-acetylglucosamine synthase-like glycosyltransferase
MTSLNIVVIAVLSVYTLFILIPVLVLLLEKKEDVRHSELVSESQQMLNQVRHEDRKEKLSIIIPFRNEAHTIINCLKGITEQDFPKELTQIILVDDSSEDNTTQIAESFLKEKKVAYTLINLKEHNLSGKKTAIEQGISWASGSIIITRDADTYTKSNLWLKSIAYQLHKSNADLVIPPVILSGTSFIQVFQQFENLAITGIGYAFAKLKLPFVCSGANLAYKKDSFLKANPYQDNKQIASGDDMFLLQSFIKEGYSISSAKESHMIVYTNAETSFKLFVNQRLRWASKAKSLALKTAWSIAGLLFLTNLLLLISFISSIFSGANIKFCLFALLYKCIIDFLLLFLAAIMFKQKPNFIFYLPAFIANLFYVPFITMASISIKPSWKGRKISG